MVVGDLGFAVGTEVAVGWDSVAVVAGCFDVPAEVVGSGAEISPSSKIEIIAPMPTRTPNTKAMRRQDDPNAIPKIFNAVFILLIRYGPRRHFWIAGFAGITSWLEIQLTDTGFRLPPE